MDKKMSGKIVRLSKKVGLKSNKLDVIKLLFYESPLESFTIREIAKRTKMSRRYLDQLAIALKTGTLIRGRSGRNGGYQLTRSSEQISLGQVIEAAIGDINIVDCVRQPEICMKADMCECRLVYLLINTKITQVLNDISLADLADRTALRSICEKRR